MEDLKTKRKIIKASMTRIYNYCIHHEATSEGIQARMDKLEQNFKEYENIQDQIDELIETPEQTIAEEAYRVQIESAYYQLKEINIKMNSNHSNSDGDMHDSHPQHNQHIVQLIDTLNANQTTLSNLVQTIANNPTSSTPIVTTQNSSVQLPRISLPQFNGQNTTWIHFRDLFTALIHNNNSLSNIEKFEYLQSHIKGDALSIIKHLQLSNENYTVAWNLINKKYNNSQQLKREYLKLLFDQPSIRAPVATELRRFLNNTNEAINALKALNEDLDKWNSMLLFHLERKLDSQSYPLWLRFAPETPSYADFMKFIEKRLRELEHCEPSKSTNTQQLSNRQRQQTHIYTTEVTNCPACNQQHPLFICTKFKALPINERIQLVKDNNICYNCLSYDHFVSDCKKSTCKICKGKHNTLLHRPEKFNIQNNTPKAAESKEVNISAVYTKGTADYTILPTALAMIRGADDAFYPCRIMLDTGSQASLITESCVQRLRLNKSFDRSLLSGVGTEARNYSRGKVELLLRSTIIDKTLSTTALCLSKLTSQQPSVPVNSKELEYFKKLQLADPQYNTPQHIDIILGANVFNQWQLNQQIEHPNGRLTALSTIFGWVIIGETTLTQQANRLTAHTCVNISEQIQKFWIIEDINQGGKLYTEEEQMAEEHYKTNVQRHEDGRYIVRLPFKVPNPEFGNTEHQAAKRFVNIEGKLHKNMQLYKDYNNFMNEYLELEHMEPIEPNQQAKYYLPHHAVFKTDSTTTKVRVVFDGSAKGTNGLSLNEQLLVGPTIQNDIFCIITQFRQYKFALSADIEKMYRQILVHKDDRPYQCILWRDKTNRITTYKLKTVTYGTSAAPFLAIRTLKQVAIDNLENNSAVADIITKNFYVDDLLFSAPEEESAVMLQNELVKTLAASKFNLRKWSSNSEAVMNNIAKADQQLSGKTIIEDTPTVKTLGLFWDKKADVFKYSVSIADAQSCCTKRLVLSVISKLYDPLGWLAPVVIMFKIYMQKLWLCGLDWDAPLNNTLQIQWQNLYNNINNIRYIEIPRWLTYTKTCKVELHGFADASEMAYAAVIYIKTSDNKGSVSTGLVASKTRVAPVKQITLPRLELCACHLLTKLFAKVKAALKIDNIEVHGWTDSTIVLAWLSDHPRKWKNFVANRTSYIINELPAQHWHHISSAHNPADLATRGVTPTMLKESILWWHGPTELHDTHYNQPPNNLTNVPAVECRKNVIFHVHKLQPSDLFERFSNFIKLLRVTTIILRFIHNSRSNQEKRRTGFLKTEELAHAHDILVKQAQQMTFKEELAELRSQKQLTYNHKLAALNPFIDKFGLLRVGGRLENAKIPYNQKHPYILHKTSPLTKLIVQYYHLRHLHAGSRQLQYLIALKYWIPGVVSVIKDCVYKCTICLRYRSKPFLQQMGNLPEHRLKSSTAFENVGVDFAGPFFVRSWKGRGSKQYKTWTAVFVCLTIKAIHLEVVTELSTSAFLASLRRFVSRRGKPAHIYSDNGTNFSGCNQQLKEIMHFMTKTSTQEGIDREMSELGIQWHFSPPCGPNFGGIWEAGVKSLKYHLYRVVGNAALTYEELNTVVCQIEGCLNSRPLSAKFVGDTDPLTPAHFLIMKPMQVVPDQNVLNTKINRLTRWQLLQQLVQRFWKNWSENYLTQLQNRPKWKLKQKNLEVNDVVLLRDDQAPPCKWPTGIITDVHPGKDDLVRVVTVKTNKGSYKRPISKLCPLLVE